MKIENTKAQMRKGLLELCVLSVVSEKEAYPSDIILHLKQNDMIVVEGTIYPLLTRLKNSGMLSYDWKESTAGPPRKYYKITEEGATALVELNDTWEKLKKTVEASVALNKKPTRKKPATSRRKPAAKTAKATPKSSS